MEKETDLRNMHDEDLLNDLANTYDCDDARPAVDELSRRLKVMRELCGAYERYCEVNGYDGTLDAIKRLHDAREAYRALEYPNAE